MVVAASCSLAWASDLACAASAWACAAALCCCDLLRTAGAPPSVRSAVSSLVRLPTIWLVYWLRAWLSVADVEKYEANPVSGVP